VFAKKALSGSPISIYHKFPAVWFNSRSQISIFDSHGAGIYAVVVKKSDDFEEVLFS